MSQEKINVTPRTGKPSHCIVCQDSLHRKSEYYCSHKCADNYNAQAGEEKPSFLSKWKWRKVKEIKDPTIVARKKTRRRTNDLIKRGKIKKRPCIVCKSKEVLPHHEDYTNPWKIIWICERHHKEYHDGKISLYDGRLTWVPDRLIKGLKNIPKKKYSTIKSVFNKKQ